MANDKGEPDTRKSVTPSAPPEAGSQQGNSDPGLGEQIATVASMIGKGWVKSDMGLWNDANYQGTGEEANRSLFTDNFDYEKTQKQATSMLNRIDQSVHPKRSGSHQALKMPLCTENAIIQCAMGSTLSKLHIMDPLRSPVIGTSIKNRCAVVTDCVPGLNFDGFGACWNILNPAVAAATLAASIAAGTFVLTPMPCNATMMPGPWMPILQEMVKFSKQMILVQPSVCNCWGLGFITINHCGQGLDASPVRFTDENGNIDWHLVCTLAANVVGTVLSGGAAAVGKAAQAAQAAKAAEAASLAVKAGQAARAAELSAQAAKAASLASKAEKVGKIADFVSNGITAYDGARYIAEGKTTEAIMSFGGMALGNTVNAVGNRIANRASNSNTRLAETFRNTLDPSIQGHFDDVMKQSTNPDFIKKIIKENPEIYGDLSHMPDADLEALIKNSKPFQNADNAVGTARATSESANQAVAQATNQRNAAKAAQSTSEALDNAKIQAQASKEAAENAKQVADTFKQASQKTDDATSAYKNAIEKVDDIDRNIREMTEQLSKLDPKSTEYKQLANAIETEKLNRFEANVDVQNCKTKLDNAAEEYTEIQAAARKIYNVDTVDDMNNVATDLQQTATTDANTVTALEQQINSLNQKAGGKTVAEADEALEGAQQKASEAASEVDNALSQQETQHEFADAAAVAEADTAAADKASTVGTVYAVANSIVTPAAGDVVGLKKDATDAYRENGYGLSAEEQTMLDGFDKE